MFRHSRFEYSGVQGLRIPAFRVYVLRRPGFMYSDVPGLSIPALRVLVFRRSGDRSGFKYPASGFKYFSVPGLSIPAFRCSGVPGLSTCRWRWFQSLAIQANKCCMVNLTLSFTRVWASFFPQETICPSVANLQRDKKQYYRTESTLL